jgi:maleate cis-trans isomerase
VALLIDRASAIGWRDDVDAVVLSCCDMPTLEAIPVIETAIGKPVTSSTQALFWRAARTVGISEAISGRGRLLAEN